MSENSIAPPPNFRQSRNCSNCARMNKGDVRYCIPYKIRVFPNKVCDSHLFESEL